MLSIWHNLTKKELMEYSPIIASKLAMNSAMNDTTVKDLKTSNLIKF